MLAKWKRDNKSIGKVRGGERQASLSSGLVSNFSFSLLLMHFRG